MKHISFVELGSLMFVYVSYFLNLIYKSCDSFLFVYIFVS